MKKIKFLFGGYSGENNTGAESRLVTIIRDIKEIFKDGYDIQLTMGTLSLKNTRRYIKDTDVNIIEMGWIGKFIYNIIRIVFQWHDVLILSEGASFTDNFSPFMLYIWLFSILVAKLCGKKVVAYAVDCGKLKPQNQRLAGKIINKIDLIIVRTEDAKNRLREYGVKKEIHITTDPAFQYTPPDEKYIDALLKKLNIEKTKPIVGIAAKEFFWFPIKAKLWGKKEDFYHWPLYHTWTEEGRKRSKEMKSAFVKFADFCVEKLDANILLIAMERMDYPPTKDIYDMMKYKDRARIISSNEYNLEDISGLLSQLKFLVSTRYHACVLSMVSSIPMIGVSSDVRIEGIFKELQIMDYYIDYLTENIYEVLVEKTEKILQQEKEIKEKIKNEYPKFLERALLNRKIFKEWFLKTYGF
jgi:polysaccharide pyruvyl transferase WcaK-like protein